MKKEKKEKKEADLRIEVGTRKSPRQHDVKMFYKKNSSEEEKKEGRCVICKPCTFLVILLETVEGLKPCHLKICFSEFCLSGLSFPSAFALFSQKLISTIQAAILSALKFPILSPAWFDLPLLDPSPCHLFLSSSVFFFFLPCRLIFRWPHLYVRR